MDKDKLEELVNKRYSQRMIAEKLNVSQGTIRHWLNKFELKTSYPKHTKLSGKYILSLCNTHGESEFIYEESKSGYRCKTCRSGNVTKQRRELKLELLKYLGGKCVVCGYDEFTQALEFDHIEPSEKSFSIGNLIANRDKRVWEEIKKCQILCAICHRIKTYKPE